MNTTSYLDPVALRQQFAQAKQNLDAENTAYENLKKDLEEKILNADELQGDTAESLRAYAADYIMILEMLMMANEDDKADAEKLIQELDTEESPLVDTDTVINGFETLTMLQEAKGKEEMYTRLADEYARAADECIMPWEIILREAYRNTANDYRQRAGIEHEKVEMCQARVDRYDRIEANTKGCFVRSSEPRRLANTALDAMPGSFLKEGYQMDINATWRLRIKEYQYAREHNLLSLRQFCPSQYDNIISSSYEIIYPEYYAYQENCRMVSSMIEIAKSELDLGGPWETNGDNITKYGKWYYGNNTSAAWCSIFVFYCANGAGILNGEILPEIDDCRKINIALVTNVQNWYISNNRYYSLIEKDDNFAPDYVPCIGDFFISRQLDKNGNWQYHIGIVEGYDINNNQIITLEGNNNDKVVEYHRTVEVMNAGNNGVIGFCSNGYIEVENYQLSGYFEDLGENTR